MVVLTFRLHPLTSLLPLFAVCRRSQLCGILGSSCYGIRTSSDQSRGVKRNCPWPQNNDAKQFDGRTFSDRRSIHRALTPDGTIGAKAPQAGFIPFFRDCCESSSPDPNTLSSCFRADSSAVIPSQAVSVARDLRLSPDQKQYRCRKRCRWVIRSLSKRWASAILENARELCGLAAVHLRFIAY